MPADWPSSCAVQRGFAGHRRAVRTPSFELAGQNRHHRIVAQVVVVVEVLISQRDACRRSERLWGGEQPVGDEGATMSRGSASVRH
jgi:hypothetical protein